MFDINLCQWWTNRYVLFRAPLLMRSYSPDPGGSIAHLVYGEVFWIFSGKFASLYFPAGQCISWMGLCKRDQMVPIVKFHDFIIKTC